jgi:divalent metal cation (Fe/Co/Zn/Cd) transporter
LRGARQARLLAWASLLWMLLEGGLGVLAGVEANRLDSQATAGEGIQNLLCAGQALAALIAVLAAAAGVVVIDPLAAVLIAGIAAKEGAELWRGEECACHTSSAQPSARGGCSRERNGSP